MTKQRTLEEIEAMEQEVREYREAERRAADAAMRDRAAPMLALLNDGTLQRVLDALPALDTVEARSTRYPTLRTGANATRVGIESVMQALRTIPTDAE